MASGYRRERLRAEYGPHVSAQQAFVIAKALRAQPRFGGELQPPIEEVIPGLLRRVQIAPPVSFPEHLV